MWKFSRDLVVWRGCSRLVSCNMSVFATWKSVHLVQVHFVPPVFFGAIPQKARKVPPGNQETWPQVSLFKGCSSDSTKKQQQSSRFVAVELLNRREPIFQAELSFLSGSTSTWWVNSRWGSCNKPWHPRPFHGEFVPFTFRSYQNCCPFCCACPPVQIPCQAHGPISQHLHSLNHLLSTILSSHVFTNNLQPKVRTYNKSDWAPTLTSLSWLTCSRSSPIQMALRPLRRKDLETKCL